MNIQDKPDYKVFASEARGGEVTDFPNLERGWGETIDKTEKIPPMEWFNLVGKRADEWLLYLTQRGVAEWDAKVKYPQYAMCQFGGRFYIAVDENENKNPVNSQAVWIDLAKYLGVDGKLDANKVVQTTGQSTTTVMSQKSVTDALTSKQPAGDYLLTNQALAVGQAYKDVTANRKVNTVYKNESSKPMVVNINGRSIGSINSQFLVNGRLAHEISGSDVYAINRTTTVLVTPNSTYELKSSNFSLSKWIELS